MAEGQTTVTETGASVTTANGCWQAFGAELIRSGTNSVTATGPAQLHGQTAIVPGDISSAVILVSGWSDCTVLILIEKMGVNPTRRVVLLRWGADICARKISVAAASQCG